DPVFDVDYEVWNTSGQTITIFIDYAGFHQDTNIISDNTTLVFLNESAICCTTDQYLDRQIMLPFEISIVSSNGVNYNKDATAISNWTKLYPNKSQGTGKIQLNVSPDDF